MSTPTFDYGAAALRRAAMTRNVSPVSTAEEARDDDSEPAEVNDELEVEVDDVLVEEVSIDGLCGVY
jgi:mycofactocin precursor